MLDLFGLGNAIVDTDVEIDDDFLSDEGLEKGQMTLVDSSRMANLVSKLANRPMHKCSGGSAANRFSPLRPLVSPQAIAATRR